MSETVRRHEELIEEEIRDLSKYLDGLPTALRDSGAFDAYEARLTQLRQELARARLQHPSSTVSARPVG